MAEVDVDLLQAIRLSHSIVVVASAVVVVVVML